MDDGAFSQALQIILLQNTNECAFSIAGTWDLRFNSLSDSARIRFNKSHDNRAAGLHFNGDISQEAME